MLANALQMYFYKILNVIQFKWNLRRREKGVINFEWNVYNEISRLKIIQKRWNLGNKNCEKHLLKRGPKNWSFILITKYITKLVGPVNGFPLCVHIHLDGKRKKDLEK